MYPLTKLRWPKIKSTLPDLIAELCAFCWYYLCTVVWNTIKQKGPHMRYWTPIMRSKAVNTMGVRNIFVTMQVMHHKRKSRLHIFRAWSALIVKMMPKIAAPPPHFLKFLYYFLTNFSHQVSIFRCLSDIWHIFHYKRKYGECPCDIKPYENTA